MWEGKRQHKSDEKPTFVEVLVKHYVQHHLRKGPLSTGSSLAFQRQTSKVLLAKYLPDGI